MKRSREVGLLLLYVSTVCGVDLHFHGVSLYTFLYLLCGAILSATGLAGMALLAVLTLVLLNVTFDLRILPIYMGAQLAMVLVLGVTGQLLEEPNRGSLRAAVLRHWAPFLRLMLLCCSVGLITYLLLFRTDSFKPAAWAVVCWLIWYRLPAPAGRDWTRIRKELANAAVFGVSLCLSLILLEAAIRLVLNPTPYRTGLMEPHPTAIRTLRPDVTQEMRIPLNEGGYKTYTVTHSDQGLRDRYYGPKETNEYRIFMLGDSYTHGTGLEYEETIPKVLEKRLAESCARSKISVINGGVGGYSPWEERIFLKERGFPLEPDLVVLQLYPSNDVANSLVVTDEYIESYNVEWRRNLLEAKHQTAWPLQLEHWLRTNIDAYHMFINAAGRKHSLYQHLKRLRFVPEIPELSVPPSVDRPFALEAAIRDPYPTLEKAWKLCEKDVAGIVSDIRQRGIDVIIYAIPVRATADRARWKRLVEQSTLDPDAYEYALEMKRTEILAESLDAPYVNVLPAFQEYEETEELYYVRDGHLSPVGVNLLVDVLEDFLVETLDVCESTFDTTRAAERLD